MAWSRTYFARRSVGLRSMCSRKRALSPRSRAVLCVTRATRSASRSRHSGGRYSNNASKPSAASPARISAAFKVRHFSNAAGLGFGARCLGVLMSRAASLRLRSGFFAISCSIRARNAASRRYNTSVRSVSFGQASIRQLFHLPYLAKASALPSSRATRNALRVTHREMSSKRRISRARIERGVFSLSSAGEVIRLNSPRRQAELSTRSCWLPGGAGPHPLPAEFLIRRRLKSRATCPVLQKSPQVVGEESASRRAFRAACCASAISARIEDFSAAINAPCLKNESFMGLR
jgi:hypothetical protein